MAKKWQASFRDELSKLAKDKKKGYWESYWDGDMGWIPDIGGQSTTDTIKDITGAGENEGWLPGDQSNVTQHLPGFQTDAPETSPSPAEGMADDAAATLEGQNADATTDIPIEEGPSAAEDVISDIETGDGTPDVSVPAEDEGSGAAESVISDIEAGDMNTFDPDSTGYSTNEGTFDEHGNIAPPDFTGEETAVGDQSNITENQITTEDQTVTSPDASDLTSLENETVTEDISPTTSPATDALPEKMESHNDWGRATKDFSASEGAGYGTLSEAIKHRGTLDKGSDEYMAVQGDINRAYGKTNRSSDYYKNMQEASPTTSPAPDAIANDGGSDAQPLIDSGLASPAASDDVDTTGLSPDVPLSDGATDGSGNQGDDGWYLGKNVGAKRDWWKKQSSFIKDIKANKK